jgi:hypothetical protein
VAKTAKAQSPPQNAPILTEVFGPMWLARAVGVPESPKILYAPQLARILWDFAYLCWAN